MREEHPAQRVRASVAQLRAKVPAILTVDELVNLLRVIPEPFRTADVDFERNVIHIKRSSNRELVHPKTEALQQSIPLNTESAKLTTVAHVGIRFALPG